VRGTSVTQSPEEKRIIRPEEFATLRDLVLLTPYGYYRARKTPWYKARAFRKKPVAITRTG
jgi:hypothetical protein